MNIANVEISCERSRRSVEDVLVTIMQWVLRALSDSWMLDGAGLVHVSCFDIS